MIAITYIVLAVAGALFGFRLAAGASLADRVIGVDGMIVLG